MFLEVISGQTLQEWIETDGTLSVELATKVADAYIALRAVPTEPKDHIIPGGLEWPVMGQIYNHENEADCSVFSRSEFNVMMDERFLVALGLGVKFAGAEVKFAHGDISPYNILVTPDNRIAFLDFGTSAWLPESENPPECLSVH